MNSNVKTALIIGGVLLALLVVPPLFTGGTPAGGGGMMGGGMMGGLGGLGGLTMALPMVLFWGLVVLGAVMLIRGLASPGHSAAADSAVEVLKRRYARGEISKEEFEQKKRELA